MQVSRSESSIINEIRRLWPAEAAPDLVCGIGDDCAVLKSFDAQQETLATVDQVIENQHFVRGRHPPDALGRKLLVRGVSDLAAMGGRARWMLLTLALAPWNDEPWLKHFLQGMFSYCSAFGLKNLALAGGDLSAGERFAATLTAVGSAPAGTALRRGGARPGDRLYVTGALGGSMLGLERIASAGYDEADPAVERHWRPTARLAAGEFLREAGATSAIDVTDGLSTDLAHIAEASGVAFEVDFEALPRFPGASDRHVLHGGEEYELLATAPADLALPERIGDLSLTPIGRAEEGEAGSVSLRRGGRVSRLPAEGFDHFRARPAE